jgi:two-component system OmpR family response regulator
MLPPDSVDRSELGMVRLPRLVVVDDEPERRQILLEDLAEHGFAERTVASGPELDACLAGETADLPILDNTMPEEDGLSIVRRIHARDRESFDRRIDIRVARLQRKVAFDAARPQVIKTVHGAGYMFVMKP